jgi:hypothetical protein
MLQQSSHFPCLRTSSTQQLSSERHPKQCQWATEETYPLFTCRLDPCCRTVIQLGRGNTKPSQRSRTTSSVTFSATAHNSHVAPLDIVSLFHFSTSQRSSKGAAYSFVLILQSHSGKVGIHHTSGFPLHSQHGRRADSSWPKLHKMPSWHHPGSPHSNLVSQHGNDSRFELPAASDPIDMQRLLPHAICG